MMKKAIKAATALLLIVGLMSVCFTTTSCTSSKTSSESMYRRDTKRHNVVKRNYKVRGNNQKNNNTYRSY